MTGSLTYAAATEHMNDLRAAAGNRGQESRQQHSLRRLLALPALHRPRRALAA
jgi:hypothetical protein